MTVINWETNRTFSRLHLVPRIFEFLGYTPSAETIREESLSERIVRTGQVLGIPQD
jgi:hypothetical protein